MAEFDNRADSVDVTQVMERIRARIRERGSPDDTERRARELAAATLDRCLEPRRTGSDLVERNRRLPSPGRFDRDRDGKSLAPEPFEFNEDTVYVSSSGGTMGKLIRLVRKLLNPVLRLFFNPDPIIFAMMRQAEINSRLLDLLDRVNAEFERTGRKFAAREELDALNYEVVDNLVAEMTRLAVDMKNHRMLVESVAARLDFDERRAKALEAVRQGRSTPAGEPERPDGDGAAAAPTRTRRRRRRRRPGAGAGAGESSAANGAPEAASAPAPTHEPAESANAADGSGAPAEPGSSPAAAVPADAREPAPPPSAEPTPPAPPPSDAGDP